MTATAWTLGQHDGWTLYRLTGGAYTATRPRTVDGRLVVDTVTGGDTAELLTAIEAQARPRPG